MTITRRLRSKATACAIGALLLLVGPFAVMASARPPSTSLWGWSYNGDGELGINSTANQFSPVSLIRGTSLAGVADGWTHALVLESNGTVMAAGTNAHGELGDGKTKSKTTFVTSSISGVNQVAAGVFFSIALKNDGTVWSWGSNTYGQLGQGLAPDGNAHTTPTQVSGLTNVVQIAAGAYFGVALESDGSVWAWGRAQEGELGDNSTNTATSPVQVWASSSGCCITGVTAVSAGSFQLGLLKSDGTMWMSGSDIHGALGNGSTSASSDVPMQVPGLAGVELISVGGSDAFAVEASGVYSWGYNSGGLLGQGTCCSDVSSPAKVTGITGTVTSISALGLALTSDGKVWTWGDNTTGQLATGSASPPNDPTPTVVAGISGTPSAVSEGLGGTCFVLTP